LQYTPQRRATAENGKRFIIGLYVVGNVWGPIHG
jgi:hypothetical protein